MIKKVLRLSLVSVLLLVLVGALVWLWCILPETFTVTMMENGNPAYAVRVKVKIPDNPRDGLAFIIGSIPYYAVSNPSVNDPVFVLDTAEDDGFTSVALQLGNVMYSDDICLPDLCILSMITEDGEERVYESLLEEWRTLLNWMKHN